MSQGDSLGPWGWSLEFCSCLVLKNVETSWNKTCWLLPVCFDPASRTRPHSWASGTQPLKQAFDSFSWIFLAPTSRTILSSLPQKIRTSLRWCHTMQGGHTGSVFCRGPSSWLEAAAHQVPWPMHWIKGNIGHMGSHGRNPKRKDKDHRIIYDNIISLYHYIEYFFLEIMNNWYSDNLYQMPHWAYILKEVFLAYCSCTCPGSMLQGSLCIFMVSKSGVLCVLTTLKVHWSAKKVMRMVQRWQIVRIGGARFYFQVTAPKWCTTVTLSPLWSCDRLWPSLTKFEV